MQHTITVANENEDMILGESRGSIGICCVASNKFLTLRVYVD